MGPPRVRPLVRYICARAKLLEEQQAYRYFLSELVRLEAQGKTFGKGWFDFIRPSQRDERDAAEIVSDVVARAGITLREV